MRLKFTKQNAAHWAWITLGAVVVAAASGSVLAINLVAVHSLMDEQLSTDIQYVVAALCVLMEGLGLVLMQRMWHSGRWVASAICVFITVLCLLQSARNEATFYEMNFSNKAQRLTSSVDVAHDTAKEKAEIEARLANVGVLRPVGTIENEITTELAGRARGDRRERTLGQLTKNCMATRSDYYEQCSNVLSLRAELANAVALTPDVEKDRARLDAIRKSKEWTTTIGSTKPGAGLIATAYNWVVDVAGGGEAHHISDDLIQAFSIVLLMALTQVLHLWLPFIFFGRGAKADAAKLGAEGARAHDLTAERKPVAEVAPQSAVADNGALRIVSQSATLASEPVAETSQSATADIADEAVRTPEAPSPAADNDDENADVVTALPDDPKTATVTNFWNIRCDYDATAYQTFDDVWSIYERDVDPEQRVAKNHFTRVLRSVSGGRVNRDRDNTGRALLRGLQLNKDARRSGGITTNEIMMAGSSAKDRRAAIQNPVALKDAA